MLCFIKTSIISLLIIVIYINTSFARQGCSGCCSWHGGIDGCDNNTGRIMCKDGSLSPSCMCNCRLAQITNKPKLHSYSSCICPLHNDEYGNLCGRKSLYSMSGGINGKYVTTCYP